jgi:hypothetical protein
MRFTNKVTVAQASAGSLWLLFALHHPKSFGAALEI